MGYCLNGFFAAVVVPAIPNLLVIRPSANFCWDKRCWGAFLRIENSLIGRRLGSLAEGRALGRPYLGSTRHE